MHIAPIRRRIQSGNHANFALSQLDETDPINRGLVVYWSLDPGFFVGGKILDLTGNKNNLTLVGGPVLGPGRIGSGLLLNGSSQYVTAANSTSLNVQTGDFGFSLWFNASSFAGQYVTLFEKGTSRDYAVYLNENNNANQLYLGINNSVDSVYLLGNITFNRWYHFVWTRAGSTNAIWLNGVLQGTFTDSNNTTGTGTLGIGYIGDNQHFAGTLDDFRIYKRALTGPEIARIYFDTSGTLGLLAARRCFGLKGSTTYTVSFSASQAAGYGLQRSGARSFAFGQSESAVLARIVARAFAAPSGNSTALIRNAGRLLSASAGESAFISLAAARRIALSAPQAAAISYARRLARLFVLGAPSPATMTRGPNRLSGAGQPEASGLVRDPARQLTTGAPSAAGLVRGPQRSLSASVTSAATVFALKVHLVVFACAQGTAFALSRTVARAFGAAAATNSVGRWLVGRILGASQPGAAGARRAVNRLYTAAQSETAQGTFARAITVSAQQSSTSSVGRVAARSFAFAQGTVGGFFRRIGRLLGWIQPSPASVTFPHSPIPNRVVILPPDSRWLESPSDSRWARLPED